MLKDIEKPEKYLAHKKESGEVEEVKIHVRIVAKYAGGFAEKFGGEFFAILSGTGHDIGKYSVEFQQRINGCNIKVDHSTFGAKEIISKLNNLVAALCVAGHHTGLPNLGIRIDKLGEPTFYGRLKKNLPDGSSYEQDICLGDLPVAEREFQNNFDFVFFTRMIFSCLVDADYLATEKFMTGKDPFKLTASLSELNKKLQVYIKANDFDNVHSTERIQSIRAKVLDACQQQADAAPGVFTLSAPTGSGKTISSLAFALQHAMKHGKDRVIYVLPYKSIIDQTVKTFQDILGKEAVLAHYSGSNFDAGDENDDLQSDRVKRFASENWDMPIVVTTTVQFFESLYASKPSKCRKLHNIANSVVILDEVQTLPIGHLTPCIAAIQQLVQSYETTVLFMSATQPALDKLLQDEQQQPIPRTEIIPDIPQLVRDLSRTTFCDLNTICLEQLGNKLTSHHQVLCIVNKRKHGIDILKQVGETEHTYLLTTFMTPKDRQAILTEIKEKLQNGEPCCVISTNLIEAGVDIDFPTVYRERAGLDSLIQAAGRCNRNNQQPKEESRVYLFDVEEFFKATHLSAQLAAMKQVIIDFHTGVEDPATVEKYFSLVYHHKILDVQNIMQLFETEDGQRKAPFRTISQRFRLIENDEATIYIPCQENKQLLKAIEEGTANRYTFRQLGRYAASLPMGYLDKISTTKIDRTAYVLNSLDDYDHKYGLKIDI